MEYKDYYSILGVSKSADKDEIKRAYRKLARKYHPDVSTETNAEEKFKEAKEAYEVLSDPEKRQAYDTLGPNWKQGQDFSPPPGWEQAAGGFNRGGHSHANPEDFSDFFSELFGGRGFGSHGRGFQSQGQDAHVKITIPLTDAYHGATRQINLQMGRETKSLNVKIPAGVTEGQQIRLSGQGQPGVGGGASGDLYLEVHFEKEAQFHAEGKDIYTTVSIMPWDAALGGKISVPTLSGKVEMSIPAGSQSGAKLRLKGKGLPGKIIGDQYVVLKVMVPPANTAEKKALYEQMKMIMGAQS